MWELDGWEGLAANFAHETGGGRDQDPSLAEWWAAAASLRRGGVDRIVVPTSWTRAGRGAHRRRRARRGVRPRAVHASRPGTSGELLDVMAELEGRACGAGLGLETVGAYEVAMADDSEAIAALGHPRLVDLGRLRAGVGSPDGALAPWRKTLLGSGRALAASAARRLSAQPAADGPPARGVRPPPSGGDLMAEPRPPAVITDDGIDRLRARINVPEPWPQPPHHRVITTDTFRHVAEAYGDDNPLWCDPAYGAVDPVGRAHRAAAARRGRHPGGRRRGRPRCPRDKRALMKGDPLRGVHAFYAAERPGVVGADGAGHGDHPPQRAGRRARQAERLRRAGGARVVGPGLPRPTTDRCCRRSCAT